MRSGSVLTGRKAGFAMRNLTDGRIDLSRAAARGRLLFAALVPLTLSFVVVSSAGGQDRLAGATPLHGVVVQLPVVDKQDIRFTHFSADKALFQGRITGGIAQDKFGFLWFGAGAGLYRY